MEPRRANMAGGNRQGPPGGVGRGQGPGGGRRDGSGYGKGQGRPMNLQARLGKRRRRKV